MLVFLQHVSPDVKTLGDSVSFLTIVGAWLGVFSLAATIAATLAAFVWSLIRIYETDTVQKWLARRRNVKQ